MDSSICLRHRTTINFINNNVSTKMKNLLNAIQNTCIAISQKENGKYFAFCEYSGHVHYLYVRLCFRNDDNYCNYFYEAIDLSDKPQLQKILDQLIKFHNE